MERAGHSFSGTRSALLRGRSLSATFVASESPEKECPARSICLTRYKRVKKILPAALDSFNALFYKLSAGLA